MRIVDIAQIKAVNHPFFAPRSGVSPLPTAYMRQARDKAYFVALDDAREYRVWECTMQTGEMEHLATFEAVGEAIAEAIRRAGS